MIKSGQVEDLKEAGFHYITAITKPQIRSMIKKGVFQLGLFDEKLCEIEQGEVRYILRRNPIRAMEVSQNRAERLEALQKLAEEQNQYLAEHPKAEVHTAIKKVWEKEGRLKLGSIVTVTAENRQITVEINEGYLAEAAELDGCYVLKTDLPAIVASKETIHNRYRDLADVEKAFRTCKTGHLELRPIYVRKDSRTRGHAFVVMLSYLLRLKLEEAWRNFDLTVEEGLKQLSTLCAVENEVPGQTVFLTVPAPRDSLAKLFMALDIAPPTTLPRCITSVDTKQKLQSRRK
jgi:hypothetical protein